MSRRVQIKFVAVATVVLLAVLGVVATWMFGRNAAPDEWDALGRKPRIRPDYSGITIPSNIAALNFVVEELGSAYHVQIHAAAKGERIDIASKRGTIVIPPQKWRDLLSHNRGGSIKIDVYVRDLTGQWKRFETIENAIAEEKIDSHLVYRLLGAVYQYWSHIGIYQRNLESYEESPILLNGSLDNGCVNCHTFAGNDPDQFLFHVRPGSSKALSSGMIAVRNDKAVKINAKGKTIPRSAGYTSWHPNGRIAAFSVNRIGQFRHDSGVEIREVYDFESDLAIIDFRTGAISTVPGISDPHRLETFPAWAPDGKNLYFCSARPPWNNWKRVACNDCSKVKYDIVRISYDATKNKWGQPEVVLSSEKSGLSLTQPRISPDGRFLLFAAAGHGAFPVLENDSDIWLMDLARAKIKRLDANSPRSESWHCWSSNSRWIVFSSKRGNGLLARPYICYIGPDGKEGKPFVMPQKDPLFYDTFLKTYNLPELITGPVTIAQKELVRAVMDKSYDSLTRATP